MEIMDSNIKMELERDMAACRTMGEWEETRVKYLGRQGIVNRLLTEIGGLPVEKRKEQGREINELKKKIEEILATAKKNLLRSDKKEEFYDPTLPGEKIKIGRLHPLTMVVNEMNAIFGHLGFSVYDGPEIETDEFNFERLNLPKEHPARDLWDTIFIKDANLLMRTHTSSVEARALVDLKPPFRIVIPGRTYRYENVTQSNHFIFRQYQGVAIGKNITMCHLKGTLEYFAREFFGAEKKTRFRCKYYPEVEPTGGLDLQCGFCQGRSCAVCKGRGWVEILGCGMIHPNLLRVANLNPKEWSGFAFGMGWDRIAMEKYQINDIRDLYNGRLIY